MGPTLNDIAYAAGFFDGEGSVYATPRKNRAHVPVVLVCMTNTHEGVVEWHKERWGGSIGSKRVPNERCKPQWQWVLAPRNAEKFLRDVLPHLVIKAEVAAVALELLELRQCPRGDRFDYSGRRWTGKQWVCFPQVRPDYMAKAMELHERIRELNRRGAPNNALRRAA